MTANYYVLECEGEMPANTIGRSPRLPGPPWMTGLKMRGPEELPLKYTLDPGYPGKMKAMYNIAYPLMSEELAGAITRAGVDNIDFFDAIITDPRTDELHRGYRTFNILGLVAAADMEQSTRMGFSGPGVGLDDDLVDVNFERLVIDPQKVPADIKLFRLGQCVTAIVVHESVREAIEKANIPGMRFYANGEWSG